MIGLLVAAALSLAPEPDAGQSPMVGPGHRHDWEFLERDEDGLATWIDLKWMRAIEEDGRFLNIILTRAELGDAGSTVHMDIEFAFDCRARKMGVIAYARWQDGSPEIERDYFSPVRMKSLPAIPQHSDTRTLEIACGK